MIKRTHPGRRWSNTELPANRGHVAAVRHGKFKIAKISSFKSALSWRSVAQGGAPPASKIHRRSRLASPRRKDHVEDLRGQLKLTASATQILLESGDRNVRNARRL